ncbi:MAG: isochorismatase family protein [Nocardioides sp.]|uniref:isochorismatase family protein n=1 Tax=Nocardioides sp. TaxID=35761 RepID=UPI0039E4B714
MPVTTLDPRSALVVIDLQTGVVAGDRVPHTGADVVRRSAELADAFRARGLPVVLVTVDGAPGVRTDHNPTGEPRRLPADTVTPVPELAGAGDKLVVKSTPGAFTGTDLEGFLRDHGVTQVVLTGIATSNGVAATANQAYELGFHVTLAVDAMTDTDAMDHEHTVSRIFPKRGETGTTAEVLAALAATSA